VASKPAQFGYARMYQTLNENPNIELELFINREKAMAWLALVGKP